MLFNSVQFIIFFPIVVLGYYLIPDKAKNIWLLIASYYFYMSWQPVYALLIFFSTFTTYYAAALINRSKTDIQRKRFLIVNIAINIAILFYFKYFNFVVSSLVSVIPSLSISQNNNLIAVVGISFYTFQSLGYSFDVYNGKVETEKNFLTYALFVSFFPQLVAGPIEKSSNLLPQLHKVNKFDYDNVTDGLVMMAWGFFKKLIIADGAAIIVNTVYNDIYSFGGIGYIIATVLFAFQLYCDFSGYSDIAIGAAKVMGYSLMRNFAHPYFAQNIQDFWKRWHISLSNWLMEYIYIPLGGSRKGKIRTYINLMITFLVSGLWHGANWTYIVWGGLNGIYNAVYRAIRKDNSKNKDKTVYKSITEPKKDSLLLKVLRCTGTFLLVDFSYIFFRANTLSDANHIISHLFSDIGMLFNSGYFSQVLTDIGFSQAGGIAIILCIIFMALIEMWEGNGNLTERINSSKWYVRWAFYYAVVIAIFCFGYFGKSQFIYFQF